MTNLINQYGVRLFESFQEGWLTLCEISHSCRGVRFSARRRFVEGTTVPTEATDGENDWWAAAHSWAETQLQSPGDWMNGIARQISDMAVPADTDGDWTEEVTICPRPVRFVREGENFRYRTGTGVWFGWTRTGNGWSFFAGHDRGFRPGSTLAEALEEAGFRLEGVEFQPHAEPFVFPATSARNPRLTACR